MIMKHSIIVIVLNLIFLNGFSCCLKKDKPDINADIIKIKEKNVIVHAFQPKNYFVSSFVIELKTRLIIMDTQFFVNSSKDLLEYAKYLDKPIFRVYITHPHPDHYTGASVFKGIAPIFALKEVRDILLGNNITVVDEIQEEGEEIIDNVLFIYEKIENTESPVNLIVRLPIHRMMLPNDLVYNKYHLFMRDRNYDTWIDRLKMLNSKYPYRYIFAGHGNPGDSSLFQENIKYIEQAKYLANVSKTFDEYKAALISKFPDYIMPNIIDFSRPQF